MGQEPLSVRIVERRHRLTRNADFRRVRREGASFSNRFLVLCALPGQDDAVRFGFSASSRVGKAIVRNRLKRLLREATRQYQPAITPGWDLVWIARRAAGEANFRQICSAVEKLLEEARLLRGMGERVLKNG